jgi:hypothetical protein
VSSSARFVQAGVRALADHLAFKFGDAPDVG